MSASDADGLAARRARQTSLLRALRLLARLGMTEGIAGHITVRDPLLPDHYWVNPFVVDFTAVTASDLQLLGPTGEIVMGRGRLNPSVHPLHGELHRARPDLAAFVHSHSMHGKTWSSLGRLLDPITQDACAIYRRHGLYRNFRGLISEVEEGKEIAAAYGDNTGLILVNHGFLAGGRSVAEAVWWFVVMERAAQSQLMAEAVGKPILIDEEVARATGDILASVEYAEIQFENLYQSLFASPVPVSGGEERQPAEEEAGA
ncbi:class II aldolase/adducin family protein [Streptomyces johnsoniae]|uniref:Class II aldolase/adducin family protein n=1 Tax=Streptomyces johnsoniae TaxID=3075532 RepID=A0ABU2S6A5_9ACTN|nr:class II aldolase/adducin family protein [Streptomyces sp. DSM 41886]MDT0444512.1 class II aldolase/adducin family protein [Streptomyces sp. DSM 41886]